MTTSRRAVGWAVLGAVTALLLPACLTAPVRPSVMVLPGSGKSIEQFQVDDLACQQWATQQTASARSAADASGGSAQGRYDIAYMQCMFAKGHRIPVRRGSPPPATSPEPPAAAPSSVTPPDVPPPPAGTPPRPPGQPDPPTRP